jgi:hypothetical protein
MKRDISVLDFPTLVATKIIDDAKRGKRFRPNPPPPLRYYVEDLAGQSVIFTETDYGNLTFTCPNCKRKNILAKQEVVLAMCKFCKPLESPD